MHAQQHDVKSLQHTETARHFNSLLINLFLWKHGAYFKNINVMPQWTSLYWKPEQQYNSGHKQMAWQSPNTDSQGPVLSSASQDWLLVESPPCTPGNNWPLIYKTFRSILSWWWKLSPFPATNPICQITFCSEKRIALSALLEMVGTGKHWKINWFAQSH